MEKIKTIILALGACYCLYGTVILVSFVGALAYDQINGGNAGYTWLQEQELSNKTQIIYAADSDEHEQHHSASYKNTIYANL